MEIQGLCIFVGTFAIYAFVLFGCMERRLKRVVKQIEEESKYVN